MLQLCAYVREHQMHQASEGYSPWFGLVCLQRMCDDIAAPNCARYHMAAMRLAVCCLLAGQHCLRLLSKLISVLFLMSVAIC